MYLIFQKTSHLARTQILSICAEYFDQKCYGATLENAMIPVCTLYYPDNERGHKTYHLKHNEFNTTITRFIYYINFIYIIFFFILIIFCLSKAI